MSLEGIGKELSSTAYSEIIRRRTSVSLRQVSSSLTVVDRQTEVQTRAFPPNLT